MRNFLTACLFVLSTFAAGQGITINTDIYGVNAWYIVVDDPVATTFGSHFESQLAAVKASGCKMVRIGGIAPNWDQLYDFDPNSSTLDITVVDRLKHLIEEIRAAGMDVIVQVSYVPQALCPNYVPQSGYSPLAAHTVDEQATIAANLVDYLNNDLSLDVKFWSIANEPDLSLNSCSDPRGFGLATENDAATIAEYLKKFSIEMKDKDPRIKIIGPDISYFTTSDQGSINEMMRELISDPSVTANTSSIMGKINIKNGWGQFYVDIISFHYYPDATYNTRTLVNDNPTHSQSGFAAKLSTAITGRTGLVDMITGAGRTINDCRIACTEFNLGNFTARNETSEFTDIIEEWDSRSFAGGQWLCEVFAEAIKQHSGGTPWVQFMNLWSVKKAIVMELPKSRLAI